MNKLPKPSATYFYSIPNNEGWRVGIVALEGGWAMQILNPAKKGVRSSQFYPSKSIALDRANLELKSLGFKKKEIQGLKNINSVYEYRTYPSIKIFSKGSRWGWICGDKHGVEKTKSKALDEACKHRKD